jgi:hypothetical protein
LHFGFSNLWCLVFGNLLWWLRGLMDRMAGGVGLRRGRRDPATPSTHQWIFNGMLRAMAARIRRPMVSPPERFTPKRNRACTWRPETLDGP